jgi:hypothetical protein
MKKLVLTLGVVASAALAANAQSNAIKLNVTSLAVATFNASFEHSLSDNSSFQLGAFYTGFSISDTKFTGFGITPEYRFYLTGESMQGFFVAPYVRYQNFKLSSDGYSYNSSGQTTTTTNEATLNTFGGGVNVGYQWVFGEHFVLEPFVRLGYNGGSAKYTDGSDESNFSMGSFNGTSVLPGMNLGFAF